jgi:hypothetical protein
MGVVSKLSELIRKSSRVEPAPLGFGSALAGKPKPTLLTFVRLSAGEAAKAGEAAAKGADAVIIEDAEARKLKEAKADVLGAQPAQADRATCAALREAGADFVVLSPETALAECMLEEKLGFVMQLPPDTDDTTLRLLGELGLDALIVPAPEQPLTLERLLKLRRIAALTRLGMLTEVSADVESSVLHVLRDSGVSGVIVNASGIGKLEALRERIAALRVRGKKQEEHADATLPAQVMHAEHDEDEYDE